MYHNLEMRDRDMFSLILADTLCRLLEDEPLSDDERNHLRERIATYGRAIGDGTGVSTVRVGDRANGVAISLDEFLPSLTKALAGE